MIWLGIALGLAVVDWLALYFGWLRLHWVAKPATLLALIVATYTLSHWQGAMLWFGLGLLFSLIGDIVLLWPKRFFGGLAAFLFAHGLYVIGFDPLVALRLRPELGLILLVVLPPGLMVGRVLLPALWASPSNRKWIVPVSVYSLVISLMLTSALLSLARADWQREAAWLVSIGAVLFYTSDSLLAYDRFVRRLVHGQFWVMVTYHLGQAGIVLGALLQYGWLK